LKQYIEKYSIKSVNFTHFKEEFLLFVEENYDWANATIIRESMKWRTWVENPGLPVDNLTFVT
jgi:hypothetical protein